MAALQESAGCKHTLVSPPPLLHWQVVPLPAISHVTVTATPLQVLSQEQPWLLPVHVPMVQTSEPLALVLPVGPNEPVDPDADAADWLVLPPAPPLPPDPPPLGSPSTTTLPPQLAAMITAAAPSVIRVNCMRTCISYRSAPGEPRGVKIGLYYSPPTTALPAR
jgi:hypothetical protein